MRAKSKKRQEAERLRREEGLSYNEIAARTGVSKSTLSYWLRDISLKPEHEARLQERLRANRATFAARALPINWERHARARQKAYQGGVDVTAALPDERAVDELALAMLYLGEGSKSGNRVQLASTDASILRYFVWALVRIYGVDTSRLSFRLNLVESARPIEQQLKLWWSQQLECSLNRFIKTQFDPRSRAAQLTGNYHGVCTVTYYDTYLQQRLLGLAYAYMRSRFAQGGYKA
ncbi:MAG: helix-turn-helix transcriptional regulator [Chloroflexi bacterium]|nr:helix-turn-helix transcriptional regulator [Chloroflexota bacterium]